MLDLKTEYLLSMYEPILLLSQKGHYSTQLVRNQTTGQLFVKKIMDISKAPLYAHLKLYPHPNNVRIIEVVESGNECITIEEYISGKTLDLLLSENGPLPEKQVYNYVRQLCSGLVHLHGMNVIHRDIQPANVIISVDGILHLIDYDISRSPVKNKSKDTTILGTAGYAAPEQFGFSQTDNRADIYAVGVLMNVMLTGKMPNEYLYPHPGYQKIITKCTEMDARNRYYSAAHIASALPEQPHLPRPPHYSTSQKPRSPETHSLSQKVKASYQKKKEQYKMPDNASHGMRMFRSIPGFRTGFPWKMGISVLGHAFLLYALISDIQKYAAVGGQSLLIGITGLFFFLIVPYFLFTNFLDLQRRLPLLRSLDIGQARALRIGLGIFSLLVGSPLLSSADKAVKNLSFIITTLMYA